MLTFTNTSRDHVTVIPGKAHIVLSLDEAGTIRMQAYCNGWFDSSYCQMSDERTKREIDKLLVELREQIQGLSKSTVTS